MHEDPLEKLYLLIDAATITCKAQILGFQDRIWHPELLVLFHLKSAEIVYKYEWIVQA